MKNPIPELISDEVFKTLLDNKILRFVFIRNYAIRKEYKELRRTTYNTMAENILILRDKYFLGEGTLRNIITNQFLNQNNSKRYHDKYKNKL